MNFINNNKLPIYRNYVRMVNTNMYNETIRIHYIINVINKDIMKKKLYENFIKKKIYIQKLNILELINEQGIDLFYRLNKIINDNTPNPNLKVLFNNLIYEFDELCNYCNNILKDVSIMYNRKLYNIEIDIHSYKLNNINYKN